MWPPYRKVGLAMLPPYRKVGLAMWPPYCLGLAMWPPYCLGLALWPPYCLGLAMWPPYCLGLPMCLMRSWEDEFLYCIGFLCAIANSNPCLLVSRETWLSRETGLHISAPCSCCHTGGIGGVTRHRADHGRLGRCPIAPGCFCVDDGVPCSQPGGSSHWSVPHLCPPSLSDASCVEYSKSKWVVLVGGVGMYRHHSPSTSQVKAPFLVTVWWAVNVRRCCHRWLLIVLV